MAEAAGGSNNASSTSAEGFLNSVVELTTTELPLEVLDCPDYSDRDAELVRQFSFWVEGVSQTSFAVLGIIGNILASVILSR